MEKYGRRIIAFAVALSLLFTLSGISTAIALIWKYRHQAADKEPVPSTASTPLPEENLPIAEELALAAEYLTEEISKDPTNPELLTKRAAVYYNLGRFEDAIADYTAALTLEEDPQTHYLRSIVHTTTGNSKGAYEDLSVALKADPENRDYLSLMADTCNALKYYDQARNYLEKLLTKEPENCVLHTLAGDACVYMNDFEAAVSHYERAVSTFNTDSEASGISKASLYSAYGNALKTLNRFEDAAQAYDQSLALEENKELYFQRGFCRLQSENYTDAITDFTKCIELEYEMPSAYFQRALCYYATNSYSQAIEDFKVYEAAFPEKTDTFLYMGLCYQNLRSYNAAITYYNKCIQADISTDNCVFNIGNCYYNLENYSSAIYYFTMSMNQGSYVYESLLNRGICYIELNKYNEAKVDLKRVIDECPNANLVSSATKAYDPIKNITIITKK